MSPEPGFSQDKTQELFRWHELATASFRAELAQRTAGEIIFDDYVLDQMRKGKPFKVALRKANARFPAEALNPADSDGLSDTEEHYRFFLRMQELDEYRRQIENFDRQIKETDQKIAELIESATRSKADNIRPPEAV